VRGRVGVVVGNLDGRRGVGRRGGGGDGGCNAFRPVAESRVAMYVYCETSASLHFYEGVSFRRTGSMRKRN